MRILITGGAGFVGSALARHFTRDRSGHSVTVLDNLRRRGSELNVASLVTQGVEFVHGDVRNVSDLEALDGHFDVMIEASAEPSVSAGMSGSPRYVLETNLLGAMNCLEFARSRCAGFVFLSSSRIYSIDSLLHLPLETTATRLDFPSQGPMISGASREGISERFANDGYRSFYGASKLAAELLVQEYARQVGFPTVINRCGVIAGPGQFGKVDQGVFTLWVARHHFGRPLKYTGFGGKGLQVRDLLHPDDLCELIDLQLHSWDRVAGGTYNVGGGRAGAVSLQEFTSLCQNAVGRVVSIDEDNTTNTVDIPWYVTDHRLISSHLNWAPTRTPKLIVSDIAAWVRAHEDSLARVIA